MAVFVMTTEPLAETGQSVPAQLRTGIGYIAPHPPAHSHFFPLLFCILYIIYIVSAFIRYRFFFFFFFFFYSITFVMRRLFVVCWMLNTHRKYLKKKNQ